MPNPRAHAPADSRAERRLAVTMYVLTIAMVAVAWLRAADSSFHSVAILAAAIAPLLLAPAWMVLGYAVADRRHTLALVAVALLAAQLVWVRHDYALGKEPTLAPSAPTLVIATANVRKGNDDVAALAEVLAGHDPDVIILEEVDVPLDEFASLIGRYPGFTGGDGERGVMIFSRLPVAAIGLIDTGPNRLPWMDVVTATGVVRVVGVHLTAPMSSRARRAWSTENHTLPDLLAELGPRTVAAGDFNATGQHRVIRALLDADFTDAHLENGRGLGATWPARGPLPPFLRIDHVMVGSALTPAGIDVVDVPGSDHRGLVATIAIGS